MAVAAASALSIVSFNGSLKAFANDKDKKVITIALTEEPPNLNSTKSTDQASFMILGHVKEGLLRYDESGKLVAGVAEKWELNDKGATFWLRKNAQWSDGKPVTANDFVFSWRLAVDPKNASEYAFIMYPVKNAEAISKGKLKPDQLGVKAVDPHTLKVEFEKPCGYFLSLMAFGTYLPIREDFYQTTAGAYASDADKMLFNGPFKLVKWVHSASLRMEKNEKYWRANEIKIDVIDSPYITSDSQARFNLFKDKKIDFVGLDAQTLQVASKENFRIKKFADGSVWYLEFNHRPGKPTANKNLRKAIQYSFDPQELLSKVLTTPGNVPGKSLFPEWLQGNKQKFRQEYPVKLVKPDVKTAQSYLEKAKKELGGTLPDLVFLTGDSADASKEAEFYQGLFKEKLGINLKIDKQTFKQRLAKMTSGDFDIVSAGWGPDYADPMTFADLFTSWNDNNRGRFRNSEYDKWIKTAQDTADPKKRMDAMAKVQEIILEELPILPTYERGSTYLQSERVSGVVRNIIGADPYYGYATVTTK